MKNRRGVRLCLLGGLLAAGLTACASYGPQPWPPGTPRGDILKAMGPPTSERGPARDSPPGTAQRLEFARGPMGRHTFMLDFDDRQRLLAVTQVLTSGRFTQVHQGMSTQELTEWLGRPSEVRLLPRQRQQVWAYRHATQFCQWFEVTVADEGRGPVVDAGDGPDPQCEKRLD